MAIDSQRNEAQERQVVGYAGPQRTVLVADDKAYNRLVIIDMLEPLGFRCLEAENGRDMVEKARECRPDLILSDLVMPVMTGFEAVQEIRQTPEMRKIPIIAMTASVFDMDKEQSRLAGCDGFLPKPIEMSKLFTFLETFLHLEWLHEERSQLTGPNEEEDRPSEDMLLIPPPPEEMDVLYDLLMLGNLSGIRERADRLEHLDSKFQPFARKLSQLARTYQDEQLLAFVKQYRGDKE
jgi:CheY-like chemotaxis protein